MEAGVYVRISSDVLGEGLGVARQEAECRAHAARREWHVAEVYVDNDVSAFSGKHRPAYSRLLDDIRSGRVGAVVAWHGDRLHRSPTELESFIDLIEATGCQVETVQSGPIDLGSPTGRLNARVVGAFARYESEHKSARVRLKLAQNAEQGKHHGGVRPYGWEDDRVTLRPSEAAVVRTAADMLLSGHSIKAIVRALNDAGHRNTVGKPWRDVTVRTMLNRPRNAGHRQHHGRIVGPGRWEPILPVEQWEQIRLLLSDPSRRTTPGAAGRQHLLSGIALCGVCGALMRVGKGKAYKGVSLDIYRCSQGNHVSRDREQTEQRVETYVCARLARPDAAVLLGAEEPPSAALARAKAAELRGRLEVASAKYADGEIDGDQLTAITARLRPQIAAAEQAIPPARMTALDHLAGRQDAAERWQGLDVSVRRGLLSALVNVTVLPTRRGPGFDPASVKVEWKADLRAV